VHLWIDPDGDPGLASFLEEQRTVLRFLCPTGRTGSVELYAAPEGASRDLVAGVNVGLVPEERALGAEERARLAGELEALEAEIGRARDRLGNEQFLARAPAEVVEGNRRRLAELEERRERLAAGLGGG
jgi:valyl-tRNA synthetase